MFALCMHLAAAIRGYMAFYMPTNRAADWLRSPQGLKWAVPAALVATPGYLLAMSICMTLIEGGGPGYLNVLVLLFAWNALKFGVVGALTPFRWVGTTLRRGRAAIPHVVSGSLRERARSGSLVIAGGPGWLN